MPGNKAFIQETASNLETEFSLLLAEKKSKEGKGAPACEDAGKAAGENGAGNGPLELIRYIFSGNINNVLAMPFIYGMIFPLLFLDASVSLYQAVCFRLFKIPRVKKSDYIALERHRLNYLNIIEKIHCDYCGYGNGLIAFTREVLARTEQYFCPIKHAGKILETHERYALFLKYGEAEGYHEKLESLRRALAGEK